MADKRKTGRRIKRLQTRVVCEGEERKGISSNFSLTGLFVKTRKKFKPGSRLTITLDSGDNQQIALKGIVAWVKTSNAGRFGSTSAFDRFNEGMGITLTETPQEYKEFLKALVQEQL